MRTKASVALFIGVVCAILYVANLAIYEAAADIFSLNEEGRLVLAVSMGVLSTGFVAATITGRRYYNAFTRFFTLITSVWIGFFTYLLFVSAAYGVLVIFQAPEVHGLGEALIAGAF